MRSLILLSLLASHQARANPLMIPEPSEDRWMYLSNTTPGTRGQASTFSALPASSGVDDRFGFFLLAFDTSAALPPGLPPTSYRIRSLKVTATIGQDQAFAYDPTPDPDSSYGTPSDPPLSLDPDPGRPLDLHGAGFRNDFTAATFTESSSNGGASPGTRNAFPLGFDASGIGRDVSNNVSEGFDPLPWATGKAETLEPGDSVPLETPFTFSIDTDLPGVRSYLQQSLASGKLWFALSSLHPATQQGGEFVSWITRDDAIHQLFGGLAPSLTLEVDLVIPLSLSRTASETHLSWPQFAGFTHTLQACSDPMQGPWQDLHSDAASDESPGFFTESSTATRRFYRLQILPNQP